MKTKLFLSVCVGLLAISLKANADPCLGTTVTYPYVQGVGYIKMYTSAINADGSTPPQSHTGVNNRDLTVTWTGAGSGKVFIYELMYDGTEINTYMFVNVINCLSFSSVPSFLCGGNSRSFSLVDTNGSTSYTWTTPTGWNINGGNNTLTTTLTTVAINVANPATQGYNAITVSSNNSGSRTYNIWVGAPIAGSYTIYPTGREGVDPVTLQTSHTYPFYASTVPGAATYTWSKPTDFGWGTGSHTGSPVNLITASYDGYFTVTCQASNSCGSSNMHNLHVTTSSTGGGGPITRMASDNDSSDIDTSLNVENDNPYPIPATQDININLSGPSVIRLLDLRGTTIQQFSGEGQATLATNNLNSGIYLLILQNASGIKQYKVEVKQ